MRRSVGNTHKGAKTSLLEVVIRRQRIDEAAVVHYRKANAIGERPSLIGPAGVEFCACVKLFDRRRQNFNVRSRGKEFKKPRKFFAVPRLAEGIADLDQNPIGCHKRSGRVPGEFQGARMEIVGWVQQRDKVCRVREDRPHFFGAPCR